MNKVILIGRLTRDPEVKMTQTGKQKLTFTLAVDRRKRKDAGAGEQTADFLQVVVWEKLAEILGRYGTKGQKIAVEGALQTRTYDKDGRKVYVTEVLAHSIEFVERKDADGGHSRDDIGTTVAECDIPF